MYSIEILSMIKNKNGAHWEYSSYFHMDLKIARKTWHYVAN